jgi:hypothetical protein
VKVEQLPLLARVHIVNIHLVRKKKGDLSCTLLRYSLELRIGTAKGVGPGPTLAWPGWKQPDIPVEVDTGRLETEVGRQEF